jgi:uncharacterized protein
MHRDLTGEHWLIRIYLGESDRFHGRPLYLAIIERLRKEGFAGATAFHGIAGFGAHSVMHTTQILRLSMDLPVIIEVVETEENVKRLEKILDEMHADGLVTLERVRVLKYAAE